MTIYQEEMQRKAQHYGCLTDYDEADQLLLISHKGVHLTAVNPEVTYAGGSLTAALAQDIKNADKTAKIDIRRGSSAEEKAAFYASVEALIGSVDFLSEAIASI